MATVDDLTKPEGEPDLTPESAGHGEASVTQTIDEPGPSSVDDPGDQPETPPEPEDAPATDETGPAVEPSLSWSDSAASETPLGAGWDAEPVILDWTGRGEPDLLLTFGGGPAGRSAKVFHPLPAEKGVFPRVYDAGQSVEGLDGLRAVCPLPNGRDSRFDLVALAEEGLVLLKNGGSADAPKFSEREPLGLTSDLGLGAGQVAQMVAIDWDGDGLVDLLVGFDAMPDYWPDTPSGP